MGMKALLVNCTLKRSPAESNTDVLGAVVVEALQGHGVEVTTIRAVDHDILPGVSTDEGPGDAWPAIHDQVLDSEIFVLATPTWLGQPSSVAKRVLERMDAMISETDDDDRPVAYNRVAGVVVTGNEDGAHHVIAEINGALGDIGFTAPGQNWTYWNMGPGPGPSYTETEHGHDWSEKTGRAMASNLYAAASALARSPIPAPPS
jgi:multimeric flavodoxin WrbA